MDSWQGVGGVPYHLGHGVFPTHRQEDDFEGQEGRIVPRSQVTS
jgi:hypothetical protein